MQTLIYCMFKSLPDRAKPISATPGFQIYYCTVFAKASGDMGRLCHCLTFWMLRFAL